MVKMLIKQYTHSGNWEECLNIFLFVELIINNKTLKELTIKEYQNFQLTDQNVKDFNEFVKLKNYDKIKDWHLQNSEEVQEFKENFGKEYKKKVEIWSDREKNDYFKKQLQKSQEFEDFLEQLFKDKYGIDLEPFVTSEGQYYKGENNKGIEIKNDMMYKKTGNLYFEYAEKSKGENYIFIKSGILKDDNSKYFLIGDYDKFWIFRKKRLVEIYYEEKERIKKNPNLKSSRGIRFVKIPTSKGYIFPIIEAEKETISITQLVKELKESE